MFVCPKIDFEDKIINDCEFDSIFLIQKYIYFNYEFNLKPIQIHAIFLSIFASIIGPFGGFFASGYKRAFKIKDFSDAIPGHGGMTDRIDCQFLMSTFVYVYYHTFIKKNDINMIWESILLLSKNQQLEIFNKLEDVLNN